MSGVREVLVRERERAAPKISKTQDGKLRQLEYPKNHIANWSLEDERGHEGPN